MHALVEDLANDKDLLEETERSVPHTLCIPGEATAMHKRVSQGTHHGHLRKDNTHRNANLEPLD